MFALSHCLKVGAAGLLLATVSARVDAGECAFNACWSGHGHVRPIYAYSGPIVFASPPRYFVDQRPDYTGPNVFEFFARTYDPGYVDTFAYPYVGRYAAWRHLVRPRRAAYVSPPHRHYRVRSQFGWPQYK